MWIGDRSTTIAFGSAIVRSAGPLCMIRGPVCRALHRASASRRTIQAATAHRPCIEKSPAWLSARNATDSRRRDNAWERTAHLFPSLHPTHSVATDLQAPSNPALTRLGPGMPAGRVALVENQNPSFPASLFL